ncbi:MAG: Rab family GTPase [Candidatus Hodarchaeota archaeon]
MSEQMFVKLVMLGDATVGKTTLVKAFIGGEIKDGYRATLGADIGRKSVKIGESELTFQIWDLSGQQSFQQVRATFYKGAKGAILVYDVSHRETFENLQSWIQEFWNTVGVLPMVIVANKIDLREEGLGEVTTNEGKVYAQQIGEMGKIETPFIEASAIRYENADDAFLQFGKLILSRIA